MIKGILFDMDGTLADTIEYWTNLIPNFIRRMGYEPSDDPAIAEKMHAMGLSQAAGFVRDFYDLSMTPEEITDTWRHDADRIYTDEAPLKAGAADFVKRLNELGIPLVLVTNNDSALADALLRRTGIRDCFKELFGGYNLGLGKTEPTMIELARKALGSTPEETWMFEDSLGPIRTAKSIGIHTAAIVDEYHGAAEVASVRSEAEIAFTNYAEADKWLSKMIG